MCAKVRPNLTGVNFFLCWAFIWPFLLLYDVDAKTCNSTWIQSDGSVNVTDILESLLNGYDKRLRPNYGGATVKVAISMHVLHVGSVSEVGMDFTTDFYFRQKWTDPRLAFSQCEPDKDSNLPSSLTVGAEMLTHIWVPDTFFVNEKKAAFHEATTKNNFLRISWDGKIKVSLRLTLTAMCTMDLTEFPLDTQQCPIKIESYGYSTADIDYFWDDDPITNKSAVQLPKEVRDLPQFSVVNVTKLVKTSSTSTGSYSRLYIWLQFERRSGYYMIQIYLPSNLIVVISWVSFWLDRGSAPARVALGVTTVLTMTTLISNTNAQLPKVSYVKSIDVYLGICYLMVFASLVEYAAVGYLGKLAKRRKLLAARRKEHNQIPEITTPNLSSTSHSSRHQYLTEFGMQEGKPSVQSIIHQPGCPGHVSGQPGHGGNVIPPHNGANQRHYTPLHNTHAHMHTTTLTQMSPSEIEMGDIRTYHKEKSSSSNCCNCKKNLSPSVVDKYSRFVFPLSYIIFNALYWTIKLNKVHPGVTMKDE